MSFRKLDFGSARYEEPIVKKRPTEKLTSLSLNKVIIGSIALASYGVAVFVVQLFNMSKDI